MIANRERYQNPHVTQLLQEVQELMQQYSTQLDEDAFQNELLNLCLSPFFD